jgi:hypothetical protein
VVTKSVTLTIPDKRNITSLETRKEGDALLKRLTTHQKIVTANGTLLRPLHPLKRAAEIGRIVIVYAT